nr:hypothetical protein [uncultured Bacteroides sp.]
MNKRNLALLYIITPFILLGLIILWILAPSFRTTEKLYYIPQVGMYLKIIKPPLSRYGYALFNKDSIFSLSEKSDYIKVYKSETASFNIIINPNIENKLYFDDRFNFSVPHPVKYNICKINFRDTTFFEMHNVAGTRTCLLKHPYIAITVDGYLESVYTTNSYEEYLNKIEPMRK